jgi:hypothetical protein
MCPHWFEDSTASYPKWHLPVRGSVTSFAVQREAHGMPAYGTRPTKSDCGMHVRSQAKADIRPLDGSTGWSTPDWL